MEDKKNESNFKNGVQREKKTTGSKKILVGTACIVVVAGAVVGVVLNKDKFLKKKNNSEVNQHEEIIEESEIVSDYELIEKDFFSFYAPKDWECKIETSMDKRYMLNDSDYCYEISGKLNGEYTKAISILISDTRDPYFDTSWGYIGLYNGDKHIFVMKNYVCRDENDKKYTNEEYNFESETDRLLESLMVKYDITNEYGSANERKTLEGLYFIKGEPETESDSFIYYLRDRELLRTKLTEGFPTEVLAYSVNSIWYFGEKIYVKLDNENNVLINDEYVEYEYLQAEQIIEGNTTTSDITTHTEEIKIEEDTFYFYAPGMLGCKIEEKESTERKLKETDRYYEISGKLNGEYRVIASIVITDDPNGYNESSWMNYGKYNDNKYIFVMRDYVIRDQRDNSYTEADYTFEENVEKLIESITVKYEVVDENGEETTIEGAYFVTGDPGNLINSYIYYVKNKKLYRTDLKNNFKTEVMASNVFYIEYSELESKIHVYPEPEAKSYGEDVIEENYVVYESIR